MVQAGEDVPLTGNRDVQAGIQRCVAERKQIMQIITGMEALPEHMECAVAIGKFDGIHIGHQKLLSDILEQKGRQLIPCVFTFDPPPEVLFGKSDGKELTTRDEKRKIFGDMGVELLVEFPLTLETAGTEAEVFVREILCNRLHCRYLAAGKDVSFGRGGLGNEALLRKLAPECGFELKTIDKVSILGQEVSSTYIRQLVKEGRMEECTQYLGRPYSFTGEIVHGNHIGTAMGFPTANMPVPSNKLMPPRGVYFTKIYEVAGEDLRTQPESGAGYLGRDNFPARGISNVGIKPTISSDNPEGVETCLFDFTGDLYGQRLEVFFEHFHRPEQRFDCVKDLKEQVAKDMHTCAVFHDENK